MTICNASPWDGNLIDVNIPECTHPNHWVAVSDDSSGWLSWDDAPAVCRWDQVHQYCDLDAGHAGPHYWPDRPRAGARMITDLDAAQAELFQLHEAIARRDEQIAALELELAAQTRHSAQLLHDLHASEARRQKAEAGNVS